MHIRIIVASTNPVKIAATSQAFEKMFPDAHRDVQGVASESGVSDQPMGEAETMLGAQNRLADIKKRYPDADYWVALEGGAGFFPEDSNNLYAFGWMLVQDRSGRIGSGRTGSFLLPHAVTVQIQAGHELNDANKTVFGVANSKHSSGAVGLLTNDLITRAMLYEPAIVFALIPFKNPELYDINK